MSSHGQMRTAERKEEKKMAPAGGQRCATLAVVLMVVLGVGTSVSLGFAEVVGHVPGRALVKFVPGTPASEVARAHANVRSRVVDEIPQLGVQVVAFGKRRSVDKVVGLYLHNPNVQFAESDDIVTPDAIPNDPSYPSQWHLQKIGGPAAWDLTPGADSIIVAIIDGGVDGTHPDLAPKLVPGWNLYSNNSDTSDVNGHGSAVAGTAAAWGNNGIGVASVAWNSRIMPIRIGDSSGSTTSSRAASGLTWAADHGARVANLSYQITSSAAVQEAARYLQSKGGVTTVSAGNGGSVLSTPDCPYLLTVGATDGADGLASFSNTGNVIDLVAPGTGILTTDYHGTYCGWQGTSFSAPIVAGVAALVLSANPALTAPEVQDILTASALDLGDPGWDSRFGHGRVDAAAAVAMALNYTPPQQPDDTTPPAVSFASLSEGATVSGLVQLDVAATDDVAVASVSASVDGGAAGTDTTPPYAFSWDTTALGDGPHTLTATATDTSGNVALAQLTVTVDNSTGQVADVEPPTVEIIAPITAAAVSTSMTVQVSASDNVGVTEVDLYVDQKLVGTSTLAAPRFKLNTRKWTSGAHTLQAFAYDAAGNSGWSLPVTVSK